MNKIKVGLTGGIASGKSVVSGELERLGAEVIDTDILSREVVEKGTRGALELMREFPEAFSDGVLVRSKLRNIVFDNESALKKLNSVVHPLIRERAETLMENSRKNVVVLVAPILFETGFDKGLDFVVTISADTEQRIQRLIKRDNITRERALQIMRAQLTDSEREELSDFVIRNDSGEEVLKADAEKLYRMLLSKTGADDKDIEK